MKKLNRLITLALMLFFVISCEKEKLTSPENSFSEAYLKAGISFNSGMIVFQNQEDFQKFLGKLQNQEEMLDGLEIAFKDFKSLRSTLQNLESTIKKMNSLSELESLKEFVYLNEKDGERFIDPLVRDLYLQSVINESSLVKIGSNIHKFGLNKEAILPDTEYDPNHSSMESFLNNSKTRVITSTIKIMSSTQKQGELEQRASCEMVWRPNSCSHNLNWKQLNEVYYSNVPNGFSVTVQSRYYVRGGFGAWYLSSQSDGMSYSGEVYYYWYSTSSGTYVGTTQNPSNSGTGVSNLQTTYPGPSSYYLGVINYITANVLFTGNETDAACVTTPDYQECSVSF